MNKRIVSFATLIALFILHGCWEVSPAFADTNLGPGGIYRTVARNVAWASANQTFILQPAGPNESLCISIQNNNPTSSHTLTLAANITADPTNTVFTGNSGVWTPAVINGSPSPVPANDTVNVSASVSGAANIALTISGASSATGTPDTLSVFVVQGAPCASPKIWNIFSIPALGVAASVSIAAVPGVKHIADIIVGGIFFSTAGGVTSFVIRDGACGTGTIISELGVGVSTSKPSDRVVIPNAGIVGTAGNAMCIEYGAGVTGTFEQVEMIGHDSQ